MNRNCQPNPKRLRRRLLERRAELLNKTGVMRRITSIGQSGDEGDQASAKHDEHVSISVGGMVYQQLTQVNLALDRMETGEYGLCASCEEPIKPNRLRSIPWAVYCVACQEQIAGAEANPAA